MFPFVRLAKELLRARRMGRMAQLTDIHTSHHICWPWDLDAFAELNNGRTLTLFDLGRLAMGYRSGLIDALRSEGWGLTMAGASVRYRQRIRAFERFRMTSRAVCWDDKFFYLEQAMWKRDGTCAHHVLYRAAVTDRNGMVTPTRVAAAMQVPAASPPMPDWIAAWIKADTARPWPPMQDSVAPPRLHAAAS